MTQLYSKINSTLSLPKPLSFVIQINTSVSRSDCSLIHCRLVQHNRLFLYFTLDILTLHYEFSPSSTCFIDTKPGSVRFTSLSKDFKKELKEQQQLS